MQKAEIGKLGEKIAAKYLAGLGYLILAKNYREKFDEIDIIARHPNKTLIFCEVKTLSINGDHDDIWLRENGWFMPEDHLDGRKLKKLIRGARTFLSKRPDLIDEERGWEIDLVAVTLKNEIYLHLDHYKNI